MPDLYRKLETYEQGLSDKDAIKRLALVFISKILLNGFSDITGLVLFIVAMAVAVAPEVLPVIFTRNHLYF